MAFLGMRWRLRVINHLLGRFDLMSRVAGLGMICAGASVCRFYLFYRILMMSGLLWRFIVSWFGIRHLE